MQLYVHSLMRLIVQAIAMVVLLSWNNVLFRRSTLRSNLFQGVRTIRSCSNFTRGGGGIFDIRTLGFPSTFSIGYVRKRLRFRILTSVWITTSMENLLENLMLWKMKNIDVAKLELTGRPHNCNNKQQHTTHAYSLL